jgi:predicted CoA-binding protein
LSTRRNRGDARYPSDKASKAADPKQILELSRTVLLVDWPSTKVPRALLGAHLRVFGHSPNRYSRAELVTDLSNIDDSTTVFPAEVAGEEGYLVFHRLDSRPATADIVYVYRPAIELPGIVAEQVLPLGATVLWLQRPLESMAERNSVTKHGLILIENSDIAEVARSLRRRT